MLFLTRKYRKKLFAELETLRKRSATAESALQQLEAQLLEQEKNQVERVELLKQQIADARKQIDSMVKARTVDELSNADTYLAANPEVALMGHLYSFLPNRTCIDIGANVGDFSERLLAFGYRVFAFEPFPPVFDKLSKRLEANSNFRGFPYALGSTEGKMPLHIATDHSGGQYDDPSLYSTLMPHAIMAGMAFVKTVEVPVRTLANLQQTGELPAKIDLVKIDTEGFDLEVIRGMGTNKYSVVSAEFWDPEFVCGRSGTLNRLDELTAEMRTRGYHWSIVIYRVEGSNKVSFYCHRTNSVKKSWGNVFFFEDHALFQKALAWCTSMLPETRFM